MQKAKAKFTPLWTGTQLTLPLEQDIVEEIEIVTRRVTKRSFTLPNDPFKICSSCEKPKSLKEFPLRRANGQTVRSHCKECANAKKLDYYYNNKDSQRVRAWQLKAKKFGLPGSMTNAQWLELRRKYNNRCFYCSLPTDELSPDHYLPAAWGQPSHPRYSEYGQLVTANPSNCRPACYNCNHAKSDQHPDDFLEWLNFVRNTANAN